MIRRYESLSSELKREIWQVMANREYYLLSGSGVSLDYSGPSGNLRSARQLTSDLCAIANIDAAKSLQQAYSLLTPRNIKEQITEHYSVVNIGPAIDRLASVPFKRIYTFNVDNALETAVRAELRSRHFANDRLQVSNFANDYNDLCLSG